MQDIQLAAGKIVQQVALDGRNLNQVLDGALRDKSSWSTAQRATLQDLSYGTLRHLGMLRELLYLLLHKPLSDPRIQYLLLVALYQLQHSKAAHHAVVDHAVKAAQRLNARTSGLVNAILRNFLREQTSLLQQASRQPEAQHNHPQWWISEVQQQYGTRSSAILSASNQHPPMTLRVNTRRSTTANYMSLLQQQEITAIEIAPDAIQLAKPVGVNKLPGFFAGLASVQDAGAQYAASLLDLHDGMHVLDACAAPGGKTAHILERANVTMLALDKDEQRLQRVAENLQRLGLSATLKAGDAAQPESWWDGQPFQRILADVPCSASGVARRHPDIKWLRRRADLDSFAAQQLAILSALWRVLAQDGKLLYATCSVFKQENEQLIAAFLEQQIDARRLPVTLPDQSQGQLLPDDQHDGFFYALLQKTA
jgi:16S rRNA (cytosine967-C5)-methyltransferase